MNWLSKLFTPEAPRETPAPSINVLIVDVRSPDEFAQGHVDGAVNLPLDQLAQRYQIVMPDKAQAIMVYCRSGARSGMATDFLQQRKYTQVINGGSVDRAAQQLGRAVV